MLDHTENQRLHDLIVHVAPLLPGPTSSVQAVDSHAEDLDPPPFGAAKVERILDRVYNRLADEAESSDPQLRKLIAETVAPSRADCPPFSAGKLRRILDRVHFLRVADTAVRLIPDEAPARPGLKAVIWAGLRAVAAAIFTPRPLPTPTRSKLGSRRSAEPLLEGPRAD
jgi:hypothetical protein